MSLDIYLLGEEREEPCACHCGHQHVHKDRVRLFDANITHNLGQMAKAAGIYKHLWRPEELGITKAGELIDPLSAGLIILLNDPSEFKKLNPENGWGSYDGLVKVVRDYLEACREHPEAEISVCR